MLDRKRRGIRPKGKEALTGLKHARAEHRESARRGGHARAIARKRGCLPDQTRGIGGVPPRALPSAAGAGRGATRGPTLRVDIHRAFGGEDRVTLHVTPGRGHEMDNEDLLSFVEA